MNERPTADQNKSTKTTKRKNKQKKSPKAEDREAIALVPWGGGRGLTVAVTCTASGQIKSSVSSP